MNPNAPASTSLASLAISIKRNQGLIWQMVKRDVIGRYKGSVMGVFWSLVTPMLLLAMYTFVFSTVFKARWGGGETGSKFQFSILLFAGMIVHGLFSETLLRAPSLIHSNISYVKKIVFPLEILPIMAVCTAIFHALVSSAVLVTALLFVNGSIFWTTIFFPLIFFPFTLLTLGLAWVLASLGVYLRDITQSMGLAMTVLLFASPVFYPLSALPTYLSSWLMLNPLTFIIEQLRIVMIIGQTPNLTGLIVYYLVSILVCWFGYIWFQRTRKGFANVL